MALTEDQKGNQVAKAVWYWLQNAKGIQYVPWVLNPTSEQYNPIKSAKQEERIAILEELESVITETIESLKEE